jgi:hypothetical protein
VPSGTSTAPTLRLIVTTTSAAASTSGESGLPERPRKVNAELAHHLEHSGVDSHVEGIVEGTRYRLRGSPPLRNRRIGRERSATFDSREQEANRNLARRPVRLAAPDLEARQEALVEHEGPPPVHAEELRLGL